jgi:hypothetical protein
LLIPCILEEAPINVDCLNPFYLPNFGSYPRILTLFDFQGEELIGAHGKLYNEELHNSYSTQNIIRVNKSKRMRSGHVAGIDRREIRTKS